METTAEDPEALFQQASQLHASGRLDETRVVLGRLLASSPAHAAGLNLMGIAVGQQGDLPAGCAYVEQAIAAAGEQPIYLRNLCELRRQSDDAFNAVKAGRRAIAAAPGDHIARLNLAMAEQDALYLDAASSNADRVLAAEPENGSAHFLRAQLLLMQGVFPQGWAEYEWRWKIPGAEQPKPPGDIVQWDGQPLDGALLLVADQGFGDIMQFARYLPWAGTRCASLTICCPKELHSLLARLQPDATVTNDLSLCAPVAAHAPFSSLPHLAGTTPETIPAPGSYLTTDPARVARWKKRLDQLAPGATRRIGIAWAGRREHRADRQRSMKLADLQPLLSLPDITFVSIQKGESVGQVGSYFGPAPLINLGPELEDFDDTAAVLTQLEALIAVDTSVIHLAGALGIQAHVMLPYRPDWRWLLTRSDSPWYHSVHLWRDQTPRARPQTAQAIAAAIGGHSSA